jgi:predicted CopG family antitoxin
MNIDADEHPKIRKWGSKWKCGIRTTVKRKLTITVSEAVYEGLHRTIGRHRISQFIEKLARPHVVAQDLEASYCEMAADQAREQDALEWSEGVITDCSLLLVGAQEIVSGDAGLCQDGSQSRGL